MSQETDQGKRSPSPAIKQRVLLLLLLLSALALHVGVIQKPFFADDYFFLEQVRGKSLSAVMTSPDPLGNFLRPVSRQIHFWVLSRVGGETPTAFHVASLVLFLGSLTLVYFLVRRLGGSLAAFLAVTFLAFHYAADVPVRWASGSQDLLALLFATATVYLHVVRRRSLAAVSLLLGLLSKESVALTAAVAILATHQTSESWMKTARRGALLIAVTLLWASWWLLTLRQRPATGQTLSFVASDVLATIVHMGQVALGLEFRLGGSPIGHWTIAGLLVGAVAAALIWLFSRSQPMAEAPGGFRLDLRAPLLRVGIAWTAAGAMPLLVVMSVWSAYYYLFALVGVAMIIAAVTAQLRPSTHAVTLGLLVLFSANARALDEFATARGSWTWQSHVDRHYLDRAQTTIDRFLAQTKSARPTLPPRSTVFYANVPVSLGWQAGDGPLLRWAYRDSSLRSYFLTQYSRERANRGPVFFFAVEGDSLVDKTGSPLILPSFAYSMLLAERPHAAVEALDMAIRSAPSDRELFYWRAWAHWGAGDTLLALSDLKWAGAECTRVLPPGTRQEIVAVLDTAARVAELRSLRVSAALSPWVHARLAALLLALPDRKKEGVIEAYAFRVLAPDDPDAWRKWSSAQLAERQYEPALKSLERYLSLADAQGNQDAEARRVVYTLKRVVRGDLAQQALQAR